MNKHVAEVINKYGDPESFAERELEIDDAALQKLPIGTKLFTSPPEVAELQKQVEQYRMAAESEASFADEYKKQVQALQVEIAQFKVPDDPMDWRLPCSVTVGHGTIGKGCKLRTLVMRMQVLYEMAHEVKKS